jgi:hypothetical protein
MAIRLRPDHPASGFCVMRNLENRLQRFDYGDQTGLSARRRAEPGSACEC